MSQSLFILGRQPALGLAELESLHGADAIQPLGEAAALADLSHDQLDFMRLGGSVKLGRVVERLHDANWNQFEKYVYKLAKNLAANLPEGKIQLGLSVYGFDGISSQKITAIGLTLKKQLKKSGRSVRLVPNNEPALSSAQVFHNHLTGAHGCELLLVHDGQDIYIAQTTDVQDIDAYTLRDRGRPKRDARVGMLPPKLAQIIINLATSDAKRLYGPIVLDPFCGTGVVLIEATMMGFDVYGSDIDKRMIQYADANLMWLLDQPGCPVSRMPGYENDHSWRYYSLEQGDATTHTWQPKPNFVACETYLGRPFTSMPDQQILEQTISEVNMITKKFLINLKDQIETTTQGGRLCIAVPAWQIKPGHFKQLPLLDSLEDLGYNRIGFEHALDADLIYARADQIIARQLLVLTRK